MIHLLTQSGEVVEAQTPVIISASRSTDIPAFFAKWFMNRLEKGYCVWVNPFNQKRSYVSFKNTKVVVFWTKNPKPIIPYLSQLDRMGIHYYFQFTLNDYTKENLEPNVASLESRIATFKKLSNLIGKEKVIWRFDPIILTQETGVRDILKKIWNIGNAIKGHTDKLVFSFVDVNSYRKVQNNLINTHIFNKETLVSAEPSLIQIEEIVSGIANLRDHWKTEGWSIELATCAEDIDLDQYGVEHNKCIDGELMKTLFPQDIELQYYLTYGKLIPEQADLFGCLQTDSKIKKKNLKDRGQRKACCCIKSKDIGMYNTCGHYCIYCYANTSREYVEKNFRTHNDNSESIID